MQTRDLDDVPTMSFRQYIVAMEVRTDGSLARHYIRLERCSLRIRLQWRMTQMAPEIIAFRPSSDIFVNYRYVVSLSCESRCADRFRLLRSLVYIADNDGLRCLAGDEEETIRE